MVFYKDGKEIPDCYYCKYFLNHDLGISCLHGEEPERLDQPHRSCLLFEREEKQEKKKRKGEI